MAQTVKNLPVMQETQVQSLGQENPLMKGMATHSSILAWRSPWTEEPGVLQSRHDRVTNTLRTQCYHSTLPASLPRAMVWEGIQVSGALSCTSHFGMES